MSPLLWLCIALLGMNTILAIWVIYLTLKGEGLLRQLHNSERLLYLARKQFRDYQKRVLH